jgi:riboflavin kinase/FMN adenylyltransferase
MTDSGRVMAVGFFDGVHIGHAALLEKVKQKALETEARPAVLSFDTHPDDLVFHQTVKLIGDSENRKELIERCYGIEEVFFLCFDRNLMNMPWDQFISFSSEEFNIRCYVVGYDFTFGRNGEGTAEKLKFYCQQKGLGCEIIDAVKLDGKVVSSTLIRSLIDQGDIKQANRFLGHPYCFSGVVQNGFHIGRQMQVPTINLSFPEGVVIPKYGVYATKVILPDGREFMAATNVGIRPTVGTDNQVSVESFLIHFNGDLYGVRVRVDFYDFLRQERKFPDLQTLSAQIQTDIAQSEAILLQYT